MNSLSKLLDFYPMISIIVIVMAAYVSSIPILRSVRLDGEWESLKVFFQLAWMCIVGGIMVFLLWGFIINSSDMDQFKYVLYSCGGVSIASFILLFFIPKY